MIARASKKESKHGSPWTSLSAANVGKVSSAITPFVPTWCLFLAGDSGNEFIPLSEV